MPAGRSGIGRVAVAFPGINDNVLEVIEAALRRDRIVVVAGLAAVSVLAWAWTLSTAQVHGGMPDMTAPAAWTPPHALLMFAMWWIMMVAMMLPSAAPFLLLGLSLHRRRGGDGTAAATWMAAGYLGVWGLFSAGATLAQWGFHAAGFLSGAGMRASAVPAAVLLLVAGLYQLTPAKRACLRRCRAPVRFVVEFWAPGAAAALRMGGAHGVYCVGCCWMLMGVLFAVGVMNPFWIGALALWVGVEKWSPHGDRLRYAAGALLLLAGVLILFLSF